MMRNQNKMRTVLLAAAGSLAILTGCGTTVQNQGGTDSNAPVITTPVQEIQTPVPTEATEQPTTVEPTKTAVSEVTPTTVPTSTPTPTPFGFLYSEDKELSMAYEKGFVPEYLWNTMEEEISLGDFCSMIREIVAETDESVLAEFDSYLGNALLVEKPADRSLASIAMYYGTSLLKVPESSFFSLLEQNLCWSVPAPDLNEHIGEKAWSEMKSLYCTEDYSGVFPRAFEGGYAWDGFWEGDVYVAAYFSMLNHSTVDGRPYFEYDYVNDTFHMDHMVTCAEGIRAAIRFYVMCHEKEYFNETIRVEIENSAQKNVTEDYDIHNLVDSITVGIHFNHAFTDWKKDNTGYLGSYDNMYDVLLSESPRIGMDHARAILKEYKEKGFHTVHLPVSWTPYYNPETKEIEEWFLDYIEYWVNLILDEGFYCIVSGQRDYNYFRDESSTAYVAGQPTDNWMEPEYKDVVDAQLTAVWTQIAERFKDYDERVMFKPFVEPQQSIFPDMETGAYDYQAKRMNEVNQVVLDAVRSVGGNSEKRPMILGPLWGQFFMETLIPPEDDYVIAYYHTYFTYGGSNGFYGISVDEVPQDENGQFTAWEKYADILDPWVDKVYDQIRVFKETYDIPLIIGEFAPSLTLPEEDRIYMTTYVMQKAHGLGCPIVFWDGYFGDNGEDPGFYFLGTDEWRTPKLFDAIFEEVENRKNLIGN